MVDISKLGIQQSIIDTKQRAQPQVVKSLSEAMDIANKDAGDEAIVEIKSETGETQYAVVDLKAGTKTAAVFDPNSTDLHFGVITRQKHHTEGTVQSSSNRLEVVDSLRSKPGSNLAAQTQSTLALAQAALDKVSGFNSKEAPFGQRVVSYDHNLETVNTLLDQSSEQINARLKTLEADLGLYSDPAKQKEYTELKSQHDELKTYQGILKTRLLLAAPSDHEIMIPGTQGQKVGQGRSNAASREGVLTALRSRESQLQMALAAEKGGANVPERVKSLEGQLARVQTEIKGASQQILGIAQAAFKQSTRVGALIEMRAGLDSSRTDLMVKSAQLSRLNAELLANPSRKAEIEPQMNAIAEQMESVRVHLIADMKSQIATFKANAGLGQGTKDALALLETEVKKLETLSPLKPEGGIAMEKAEQLQKEVENIQLKLYKSNSDSLLSQLKKEPWQGISPEETRILENIDTHVENYTREYQMVRGQQVQLQKDVDAAKAIPDFQYAPITQKNLLGAQSWTPGGTGMSGVEANQEINRTYHSLDHAFQGYLGQPTVPNWMTFGKYASREAGQQIMNLEASLEALHTLATPDGTLVNDERSVKALARVMVQDKMVDQSIRMAAKSMGINPALPAEDLVKEMVKDFASSPTAAPGKIAMITGNLEKLHAALVKGNTRIYHNIVPAYDIFMKAEMAGGDGIDALQKAGYGGKGGLFVDRSTTTGKDPQGFVLDAFKKYKAAKNMHDQIQVLEARKQSSGDASGALQKEIDGLQKQRGEIIHAANLLIGCQEQMGILQDSDIFTDPLVNDMLGAMSGTMTLTDQLGTSELLPGATPATANWADFPTRMGLTEVPVADLGKYRIANPQAGDPPAGTDPTLPAVVRVEGPSAGNVRYFKTNGNPGTISTYFADRTFDSAKAASVSAAPPRDITPLYRHNVEGKVEFYDRALEAQAAANGPLGLLGNGAGHILFD
jgi:hypothetical protein